MITTVLFNKQKRLVRRIFDCCDLCGKSKCNSLNNYNGIRNVTTTPPVFALPPGSPIHVFDRNAKFLQKERALNDPDVKLYDYLKDEIGYRLSDRIFDIKRTFNKALDLGCGRGHVSKHILKENIAELILADTNSTALEQAETTEGIKVEKKVIDEEEFVLEPESLDLVISCLSLHWVNDLPGCFKSINNCLKKDGAFLGAIFGGDTLYELRGSLQLAELERDGGISPHVSPFTEVRDVGSLLTAANFTMLTIDVDEIVIGYPSMFELMWDLKGMAENNAVRQRKLHLKRDTLMAAAAIYQELYGKTKEDGTPYVPGTFQIIYMLGWKPHPSQPKPVQRGSGKISLKDIDKFEKIVKDSKKIKIDED